MKKFTLTITEEQRNELLKMTCSKSSQSNITRDYLYSMDAAIATTEVHDEVRRLSRVWSTLYSAVLGAKYDKSYNVVIGAQHAGTSE